MTIREKAELAAMEWKNAIGNEADDIPFDDVMALYESGYRAALLWVLEHCVPIHPLTKGLYELIEKELGE